MLNAQLLDFVPNAIHPHSRVRKRLLRKNSKKLLTAVAIQGIAAPKVRLDGSRDPAKCVVPREVTKVVIVRLERVDITQRGTVTVPITRDASLKQREILLETPPI